MAAKAVPFKASSHIRSITYDADTSDLVVSFGNGSYLYEDVKPSDAEGFSSAESAGKYLNSVIIAGDHPTKKL